MPSALASKEKDLEMHFKGDSGKAVIEGKTTVPFQAFVTLILQRKVLSLFKQWGKEPVVVSSELLTGLASAPQDSVENRSHLVLVSMGVGVIVGATLFAVVQAALLTLDIMMGMKELLIVIGSVAALGLIAIVLMRMQRVRRSEQIVEAIESLSSLLSK